MIRTKLPMIVATVIIIMFFSIVVFVVIKNLSDESIIDCNDASLIIEDVSYRNDNALLDVTIKNDGRLNLNRIFVEVRKEQSIDTHVFPRLVTKDSSTVLTFPIGLCTPIKSLRIYSESCGNDFELVRNMSDFNENLANC